MPRLSPVVSPLTFELDGRSIEARPGETLATAMLAAGEKTFSRSPKYHRPRGPFCLTGACAQCLVRIDGVPNLPACRVEVKSGMRVERQNTLGEAGIDLLRANDFVFREWFNHHEFMATVPIADVVMQKIARQLSGLGVLPDKPAAARPPATVEHARRVIVGAGVAGTAAAQQLAHDGHDFTWFEHSRLPRPDAPALRTQAEVVGLFADDGAPFLAVVERGQLHLIFYERLLLAVGGHPTLLAFENNDLPGVMSGRAVERLIREERFVPGKRIACVGDRAEADALALLIRNAGSQAIALGEKPHEAFGLSQVTGLRTDRATYDCDVVAICSPVSPAYELARAAGAHLRWNDTHRCFVVETDERGQTARLNVFVAGDARAPVDPTEAAAHGRAAARAMGAVS